MVQVAVKFRTKDESNKTKIEAKNSYVVLCSHLVDRMVRRSWSSPRHQWLRLAIKCTIGNGAKSVVLCPHLGRPNGEKIEKLTIAPVAKVVNQVCPEDGAESVALCSHLGRPNGEEIEKLTMALVAKVVNQVCLRNGAESVVFCSHLGRPNGEEIRKFSMAPMARVVNQACP